MESKTVTGESTAVDSTRLLRWEGKYWALVFDGTTERLRDAPGLHHLAVLLTHPREQISSLALEQEGLGCRAGLGRPRRELHDARERARRVVSDSIAEVLDVIATYHPSLAGHLRRAIRLGTLCSYDPDCEPGGVELGAAELHPLSRPPSYRSVA